MSDVMDIRNGVAHVSKIKFADVSENHTKATMIVCKPGNCIAIVEDDAVKGAEDVRVTNTTDARNLILALEKAIELGWLSTDPND